MKASGRDVYYIEVVGRALDVLEVFVHEEKTKLSLNEIAKRLDQSVNTTFRLLYTLGEHGYVVKTDKKYELGPKLLDLTNAKLRNTDLISIAGPFMDALRERFRETVNLGVMMNGEIRYVDVRESLERFRLAETVGGTDPLHCTALGKAHMAYLPFADVRTLLRTSGMPRVTEFTITSITSMREELLRTRERGYALDLQESMLGGFCVAVPVLNEQERPVAAMSIAGPYVRFNEAHVQAVASALFEATGAIAEKLRSAGPVRVKPAERASKSSERTPKPAAVAR